MVEYKDYVIVPDKTFGMKLIQPKTGNLPNDLRGSFSTSTVAKRVIDNYLANKRKGS